MIMHTFADWGNTGQNMAESIGNTTVSTTKVIISGPEPNRFTVEHHPFGLGHR